MDTILQGFSSAFKLITALDPELLKIIWLSLQVSAAALLLALILGLPLGALLALKRLPLRGLILSVINTGMGLPPVVVGLFVYLLLSRSGPLGFMELLYTPGAMIIAQLILSFPIVTSLSHTAIVNVNPIIRQAAQVLGANPLQEALTVIREARYGIMTGGIAALGRVTAEVGAVIMVGGNIAGYTRVMTTTIALETDKGNFDLAIALGIILLGLSLMINVAFRTLQKMGRTGSGVILWD
ncbi:MAG: ABC transporter permease [Deltaproteobacteria bacterium]|nr:ABC transporter permease [Deltaproteobacteria bacterium]MBI4795464.1 ABC transporter permease [Deltaproteobacteria bacterium]